MANKNIKKFYQHSDKQYYYLPHALGHGAPTTVPEDSGLMYIDIDADNIYVSVAKSQVSDWKLLTGGSGGSLLLKTNGTDNGDQTVLNLAEGTGITITDDGSGNVTIDSTGGGGGGSSIILDANITVDADSVENVISALSFNTVTNGLYSFRAVLNYGVTGTATNTGTGSGWAIKETASGTYDASVFYSQSWDKDGNLVSFPANILPTTGAGSISTTSSYSSKQNVAIIEGVVIAKTGGTLSLTFCGKVFGGRTDETITVYKGSTLTVYSL